MEMICQKSDYYSDGTPANNCFAAVIIYCQYCGKPVERRCKHGTVLFRVNQCVCGYYYYSDNNAVQLTASCN